MKERPDGESAAGLDFDPETGLIPAVVQDVRDGQVRVLAYMNRRSLERTRRTGRVTFFSRSREELWEKGATSGNWLEARSIEVDCDGDALLVRALPHGPTCHTGRESCFEARTLWEAEAGTAGEPGDGAPGPGPPAPGPDGAAGAAGKRLGEVLGELAGVVARRDRDRPEGSYTARLLEGGPRTAGRKVAEEALEVALDAEGEARRLAEESADLLYHLLVLWRSAGVEPEEVARVLERRRARPRTDGDGSDPGA